MIDTAELIKSALAEDIGSGDITTDFLIDPEEEGKGEIVAKESLILAGLDVARRVFHAIDPQTLFLPSFSDGDSVTAGTCAVRLEGKLAVLLKGERTALNFLQHLSGIATYVRGCADMLGDSPVRLLDTRKTTPGLRVLEKYAVRAGGGRNHRMGLYDGVLIKDNHIAACGGIGPAVDKIRQNVSHFIRIEVEASDMREVREAVEAGADIIMLDNMDDGQIREAVRWIGSRALVEVSGGVTRDQLKLLARTGVDFISSGALTHSARSVDLSMRIERKGTVRV